MLTILSAVFALLENHGSFVTSFIWLIGLINYITVKYCFPELMSLYLIRIQLEFKVERVSPPLAPLQNV